MAEIIAVTEQELVVIDGDSPSVIQTSTPGTIIQVANTGPQGPVGPAGPSGTGDKTFSQSFTSQSVVTVNHNLGKYPSVSVLDSAGDECEGDIDHISLNQLTVIFSAPFSGTVTCN